MHLSRIMQKKWNEKFLLSNKTKQTKKMRERNSNWLLRATSLKELLDPDTSWEVAAVSHN